MKDFGASSSHFPLVERCIHSPSSREATKPSDPNAFILDKLERLESAISEIRVRESPSDLPTSNAYRRGVVYHLGGAELQEKAAMAELRSVDGLDGFSATTLENHSKTGTTRIRVVATVNSPQTRAAIADLLEQHGVPLN